MWRERPAFADRRDAGRRLARALAPLELVDPLVLALPRGGVPVGFEIAAALKAELDILIVRKIGSPRDPELGLGAVVDGDPPQLILNPDLVRATAAKPAHLDAEYRRQIDEIGRRRKLYGVGRAAVLGRNVILVDDGIATGGTVRAALAGLAGQRPARLVLAVPVAPQESLDQLRAACDEVVCLLTPELFRAVGEHYADFTQTTDEEVVSLLAQARSAKRR